MAKSDITKPAPGTPSRPRDVFGALRDEMDRVFERVEHGLAHWPSVFRQGNVVPELDVRENATSVTIEAELPGVEEKDISVTFANGVLTIRGEKKQVREETTSENVHVSERSFGSFERSLHLPESVDDGTVEASFNNGVLKVTAAKKPEAVKAERKIEIKKAP
jgi:HSP20 family protein